MNTFRIREESYNEKLNDRLDTETMYMESGTRPLFQTTSTGNMKRNMKNARLIVKSYSKPATKQLP